MEYPAKIAILKIFKEGFLLWFRECETTVFGGPLGPMASPFPRERDLGIGPRRKKVCVGEIVASCASFGASMEYFVKFELKNMGYVRKERQKR